MNYGSNITITYRAIDSMKDEQINFASDNDKMLYKVVPTEGVYNVYECTFNRPFDKLSINNFNMDLDEENDVIVFSIPIERVQTIYFE